MPHREPLAHTRPLGCDNLLMCEQLPFCERAGKRLAPFRVDTELKEYKAGSKRLDAHRLGKQTPEPAATRLHRSQVRVHDGRVLRTPLLSLFLPFLATFFRMA